MKKQNLRYAKPHFDLSKTDLEAIQEILLSGWVSIGKHVLELEENFKRLTGAKYAIATTSASQALFLTIKALGWEKMKVALPSFTWPSTYYAIEKFAGIEPVFADIDPETWLIDLDDLKKRGEHFDAVLAVDLFGNQCHLNTDKPIVYDAAHAFGLPKLGKRGIAEIVSLSFSKVLTACEGGVILTDQERFAGDVRYLRRVTSRISEINAYLANRAIEKADKFLSRRQEIVDLYIKHLKVPYQLQRIPEATNHSVFSILLPSNKDRECIVSAFNKADIEVKIYHDPLVSGLAVTDDIYSRSIALPVYYEFAEHVPYVCDLINKAIATKEEYVTT